MNQSSIYIECDIPPGMTCTEYRRRRAETRRQSRRINRLRLPRRPRYAI
jgi:hypothetical protein